MFVCMLMHPCTLPSSRPCAHSGHGTLNKPRMQPACHLQERLVGLRERLAEECRSRAELEAAHQVGGRAGLAVGLLVEGSCA